MTRGDTMNGDKSCPWCKGVGARVLGSGIIASDPIKGGKRTEGVGGVTSESVYQQ